MKTPGQIAYEKAKELNYAHIEWIDVTSNTRAGWEAIAEAARTLEVEDMKPLTKNILDMAAQYPTLHDQFAMAALPGILHHNTSFEKAIDDAFRVADAMLDARKEKEGK